MMPKQIYSQDSSNESTRMLAAVINKDEEKKMSLLTENSSLWETRRGEDKDKAANTETKLWCEKVCVCVYVGGGVIVLICFTCCTPSALH